MFLKSTHEGILPIGEMKLNVAVLEDGTRVITQSAIFKAFGRTKRGRAKDDIRVLNRPAFIDAKNLQPFIDADLEGVLKIIEYTDKTKKDNAGYNALILPKLCKIYLDAREERKLAKQQLPLARASEILLLGLSNIGIISLVDEVTGYQYERERDELQKILQAYIAKELLPWQKTFPDIYYREIFRLNGWNYTVHDIKRRPSVVGRWTNKIIYERLPKGVLKELKSVTPKSETGNYTARFFQSLTPDIGNPHLQNQLNSVITLMRISDDWHGFIANFNKLIDRQNGQLELKFEDLEYKEEIKPKLLKEQSQLDEAVKKVLNTPPIHK